MTKTGVRKETLSELISRCICEFDPKGKLDMPNYLSIAIYQAGFTRVERPCPHCKTMTERHFAGCGRDGL